MPRYRSTKPHGGTHRNTLILKQDAIRVSIFCMCFSSLEHTLRVQISPPHYCITVRLFAER